MEVLLANLLTFRMERRRNQAGFAITGKEFGSLSLVSLSDRP